MLIDRVNLVSLPFVTSSALRTLPSLLTINLFIRAIFHCDRFNLSSAIKTISPTFGLTDLDLDVNL